MGELLATISSDELNEWAAFYRLDPFGMYRSDLQAGIIASTLANIYAAKGKRFTPSDFMPKFQTEPTRPMTHGQIVGLFRVMSGGTT